LGTDVVLQKRICKTSNALKSEMTQNPFYRVVGYLTLNASEKYCLYAQTELDIDEIRHINN